MPQSLAKNLIHLIYSTKHRQPWIPHEHRDALYTDQAGIFKEWDNRPRGVAPGWVVKAPLGRK